MKRPLLPSMKNLVPLFLPVSSLIFCFCQNPSPSGPALPETQTDSPEIEADGQRHYYNAQGDSACLKGDFRAAIAFYQQAMDTAAAQADSFPYYDSKLDLANVYEKLGEYAEAVKLGENVVAAYLRSGDSVRTARAYMTISSFYFNAKMPEKELAAVQKAFQIQRRHGPPIERCAVYNSMAFRFSTRGDFATALPLLDTAHQLMVQSGILEQEPSLLLNIGDLHRKMGHWGEAKKHLLAAEAQADSLGQTFIRSMVFKRLSQLEEARGEFPGALSFYRKYMDLRDSVFSKEKMSEIQELRVAFETKEKEREIELLQATNRAEVLRRNLSLSLAAFALLAGAGLFFFWREKLRSSKKLLEQYRRDFQAFLQTLKAKNAQIIELEQKLAIAEKTASPENQQLENRSENPSPEELAEEFYNRRILTDTDWTNFKEYFERTNPAFLSRLRRAFPEITSGEERLFLLIKLNFNRQEIADILGISALSVKKGRTRLRKRLGLQVEDDLETLVRNF